MITHKEERLKNKFPELFTAMFEHSGKNDDVGVIYDKIDAVLFRGADYWMPEMSDSEKDKLRSALAELNAEAKQGAAKLVKDGEELKVEVDGKLVSLREFYFTLSQLKAVEKKAAEKAKEEAE